MSQRVEVRDGREFIVTELPADKRLTPSATRDRQMFQALTPGQKRAVIRERVAKAKRRTRKRRRWAGAAKRTAG